MAAEELQFVNDGMCSRIFSLIWGRDQRDIALIELIMMEIMSPAIVDGRQPVNKLGIVGHEDN